MNILKEIIAELKQTNWLTFMQLVKLTGYTLLFCGIIALLILGFDLIFFKVRDLILNI